PWSWAAYAVAAILVLTALVRFCPAYALFGASTCERSASRGADKAPASPSERPSSRL
ncbi:MAG TPA: DUF2892 domain-containing protein, partial [Aurantimonas sp.]